MSTPDEAPAMFELVAPEPDPAPALVPAGPLTTSDMNALLKDRYAAVNPGNGPRYVLGFEVRNRAGHYADRSCDCIAMDTWQSGPVRLIGHEVKVSRSDWLRELKDPGKAMAFIPHVAEWWLVAADRSIVREGELPAGWGLLAPAGSKLRAVVKARRKPQEPIPIGLMAALLRSVQGHGRAEVERAKTPKPHTAAAVPFMPIHDYIAYDEQHRPIVPSEIQRPRYDLRRRV